MLESSIDWATGKAGVAWLIVPLVAALLVYSIYRHRRKKSHTDRIRQDGIKMAVTMLNQREQFELTYQSGRYRHKKSIPRTLDPALMTARECARRDNGIGEFSPEGRYLEPPEMSWD